MSLSKAAATTLVNELAPALDRQKRDAARLDRWVDGRNEPIRIPREASAELRQLAELAPSAYGGLVITGMAQTLQVAGYRMEDGSSDVAADRYWRRNRMGLRSNALHRGAMTHGESYVVATLGVDELTGEPFPSYRCYGADAMSATYADQAYDEWPLFTVREELFYVRDAAGRSQQAGHVTLADEECEYVFGFDGNRTGGRVRRGELTFIEERPYDVQLGINPTVRYANVPDLAGYGCSDLTPLIPIIGRADQTEFDRLVTQRFNAFQSLWIAGIDLGSDKNAANAAKLKIARDRIAVFKDANARAGAFPASGIEQYSSAKSDQLQGLAAIGQLAPHTILGLPSNLGIEALEAAMEPTIRKRGERQVGFGEGHLQLSRLGHALMGADDLAADMGRTTYWKDVSIRSLAQTADALGKLATMLGVPARGLWNRIPDTTAQDLANWENLMTDGAALDKLVESIIASTGAPAGQGSGPLVEGSDVTGSPA